MAAKYAALVHNRVDATEHGSKRVFTNFHHAPISALFLVLMLLSGVLRAQKTTIQPTDIVNIKRVGNPVVSPDGSLVAYTVETSVPATKHPDTHIWMVSTNAANAGRPFAYSGAAEHSPAWSPDGSHLAFLSSRPNPLAAESPSPFHFSLASGTDRKDIPAKQEDKSDSEGQVTQLWWIPVAGGEAEPLTNFPGGVRSFKWSVDGKFIAIIRTDTDAPDLRDRKKAKRDDQVVVDQDYHYDRLWIYDLALRQARLLTTADLNIDAIDWSPDGSTIAARVSPTPRMDDYWRVSKVVLLDTRSGAITKTLEEHSGYSAPSFSHDGTHIAFSRFTQRSITDEHFIKNLSDGSEVKLETKLSGTIQEMHWLGSSNHLLVFQLVAAHSELDDVDISTFSIVPITGMPVAAERFNIARNGLSFSFLGETTLQPAEPYVWHGGHVQALANTNPQVANWSIGTQHEISWENPNDHRRIYGVLVLPPGYKSGERYKTIVHVHGGPEEAWILGFNGNWYNYATLLASHGYVVLLPDPRGSEGQGVAFTEANYQDWGGGDFADIMAGVDFLIAKGISDPNRLAIGGWSFGGFMTSWAVTHTDRFKAAMDGAGVVDLYSMATTTDISPRFEESYMGELAANIPTYDRRSPVRYVERCHTPVLILHGEADPRVPVSQGEEFYKGLRFLHKDVSMVRYPRESHIFTERDHQIDSLTRILAWYDLHLGKE